VAARSVKVIGQESREERVAGDRDAWWSEIREDIRAHARALDCSHVLGYTETTTIHEDVCVLSGAGTACVLDLSALAGTASQVSRLGRCSACHISYSHRFSPNHKHPKNLEAGTLKTSRPEHSRVFKTPQPHQFYERIRLILFGILNLSRCSTQIAPLLHATRFMRAVWEEIRARPNSVLHRDSITCESAPSTSLNPKLN